MTIYNCTPHTINIYHRDDVDFSNPRRLTVKPSASPVMNIPPSGVILNATVERLDHGEVDGIPLVVTVFNGVDNPLDLIPDSTVDDYFIVSALFKSAAASHPACNILNLVSVDSVVYDGSGDSIRPVGCLSLAI